MLEIKVLRPAFPPFFPLQTVSKSLKVDFAPVVQNVTYYNTGDEIKFNLNLTHNQSAVADITSSLNVMISSQFLEPKTSSLSGATGLISNQDLNSSALSFSIASLDQNEVVNVSFVGIVKSTIHPLAGLYFVVHVTGTNGSSTDYHYGPVPSLPTLYAVFPRVSLRRASYEGKFHPSQLQSTGHLFVWGHFRWSHMV